jgi:hypothetical protein
MQLQQPKLQLERVSQGARNLVSYMPTIFSMCVTSLIRVQHGGLGLGIHRHVKNGGFGMTETENARFWYIQISVASLTVTILYLPL